MNKKIIKSDSNPSKETTITTWPGRLKDSNLAIREILETMACNQAPVVYDIGIGWHPSGGAVTTKELKAALPQKTKVIGIDRKGPRYFIQDETYGHILFDKNKQPIGSVRVINNELPTAAHFKISTDISIPDLKDHNLKNIKPDNEIKVVEGDLFDMNNLTDNIPQANLVRIANLLFTHYSGKHIKKALKSLHPKLADNSIVMVGKSACSKAQDSSQEEYLLYKKEKDTFSLDSYLFYVNYLYDDLSLGFGFYDSDFISIPTFYLKEILIEEIDSCLFSENRSDRNALCRIIIKHMNNNAGIKAAKIGHMIQIPLSNVNHKELNSEWQKAYEQITALIQNTLNAPFNLEISSP